MGIWTRRAFLGVWGYFRRLGWWRKFGEWFWMMRRMVRKVFLGEIEDLGWLAWVGEGEKGFCGIGKGMIMGKGGKGRFWDLDEMVFGFYGLGKI
jgi:hypothetical protein